MLPHADGPVQRATQPNLGPIQAPRDSLRFAREESTTQSNHQSSRARSRKADNSNCDDEEAETYRDYPGGFPSFIPSMVLVFLLKAVPRLRLFKTVPDGFHAL